MKVQMRKHPKRDVDRKYGVGIDPGLATTAVVLMRNDIPIRAFSIKGPRTEHGPVEVRARMIACYVRDRLQRWVSDLEIEDLHVNIEVPFFRVQGTQSGPPARREANEVRNVKTFQSQMTLYGCLCCVLSDLNEVFVHLGAVNNQTAKAMFTGDGNASKMLMVSHSAWYKRPDVDDREHLADAQAIATVYPDYVLVSDDAQDWMKPSYIDSNLGKGKAWTKRWPRGGRGR